MTSTPHHTTNKHSTDTKRTPHTMGHTTTNRQDSDATRDTTTLHRAATNVTHAAQHDKPSSSQRHKASRHPTPPNPGDTTKPTNNTVTRTVCDNRRKPQYTSTQHHRDASQKPSIHTHTTPHRKNTTATRDTLGTTDSILPQRRHEPTTQGAGRAAHRTQHHRDT